MKTFKECYQNMIDNALDGSLGLPTDELDNFHISK